MKFKRLLLVLSMCILFITCFQHMSNKYDVFARYDYLNDENEALIRKYITDPEDIEFIIQRQIRPEQFMRFLQVDGFVVRNIIYYDICWNERPTDVVFIVNWVNSYRSNLDSMTLDTIIRNFTYESLSFYFDNGSTFVKDSQLVSDPSVFHLIIEDTDFLLDYKPVDLVDVDMQILPSASVIEKAETIALRQEVITPLQELVTALSQINNIQSGGLILTNGFVSYSDQIEVYKSIIQEHGSENFLLFGDFPGQSENQLGYTVSFTIAGADMSQIESTPTYQWLMNNAHLFGFVQRFPNGKEQITGKIFQPLTFRYVGKEVALKVFESKTSLNEVIRKMK